MRCPKCGKQNLLVEGLGEGKTRLTCQACGYSEVKDREGRPLLTEVPRVDKGRLLTEAR
jgi:ribosomal protein S27AE